MRSLLVIAVLVVSLPAASRAADVVINNGLAPPNPANVIDDGTYSADTVWSRNVGCPPGWPSGNAFDPCPSPGAATAIEVVDGASVSRLEAHDTSSITLVGGTVSSIVRIRASGSVTMTGGTVLDTIHALASSTFTMTGGTVSGAFEAHDSSVITLVGRSFRVDGSPVPYGDLTALNGTLTGTLASGDPVDNVFYQGGASWAGTITLVEAPPVASVVPPWAPLALVAGLLGAAALRKRAA
jgi:hypothetical protein